MIQLILLSVLAGDPSGLEVALTEADGAEIYYARTQTYLDIKGEELNRLAKLIKLNDEVLILENDGRRPGTNDVFSIRPYKGKEVTEFTLLADRYLVSGDRQFTFANRDFPQALRDYFEARKIKPTVKPEVVREINGTTVRAQVVSGDDQHGRCLLTAGDGLSVFSLNNKGSGTSLAKTFKHDSLSHAKAIAKHGRFVYVAGGVDVVVFRQLGSVSYDAIQTVPVSANALHAADGKLYAACTGKVQVYEIEDKDVINRGKLRLQTSLPVEGAHLVTDVLTKGDFLYVTTFNSLCTYKDGKLVGVEKDELESGHYKPQDRGLLKATSMTIDGDKLYIVSVFGKLSVWDIKDAKPVFLKCLRDDREAEGIDYAKDVVVGDGRVWVIGQRDESLAWFEWKEDDLVCGGSIEVGPFDSLASHDKFLFLGGHEKLKVFRTGPFPNPIPVPGE